jgi:hypothetical protein
MKIFTKIICFTFFITLTNANQFNPKESELLHNAVARDFSEFGGWESRCTQFWSADSITCVHNDYSRFCTVEGMRYHYIVKNIISREAYSTYTLLESLTNLKGSSEIKITGIECFSELSGFANCGSDEDRTECTYKKIESVL